MSYMDCWDFCPRCNGYALPMVWLGDSEGWICEDCYEKEVKKNEHNSSGNHSDNLRNSSDNLLHGKQ